MRFVAGLLLLVHAFAHLAIWLPAYDANRHTFDAKHSIVLANAGVEERRGRRGAILGAVVVWGAFIAAGFGTMHQQVWANEATAGAAVLSIMLAALYFHPWLSLLLVVDLAIIYVAL